MGTPRISIFNAQACALERTLSVPLFAVEEKHGKQLLRVKNPIPIDVGAGDTGYIRRWEGPSSLISMLGLDLTTMFGPTASATLA
jgi:hypothetical protein